MSYWPFSGLLRSAEPEPDPDTAEAAVSGAGGELEVDLSGVLVAASSAALAGPPAAATSPSELQLPLVPRPKPSARPPVRNLEDLESVLDLGETTEYPRPASFRLAVIDFDPAFERAILKARDPQEIEALVPDFLLRLADHDSLDVFHDSWNQVARIGRALRAGISAHHVLTEQFHKQARSPVLPFKNEIYVCLRCIRSDRGWWTRSYSIYIACIENPYTEGRDIQEHSAMAEGAPVNPRPLSLDELAEAVRGSSSAKVLPTVCFTATSGDPPVESRVLCYLLRCRANGFMALLPGLTSVQALLDTLVASDGTDLVAYKLTTVGLEDSRGRKFGRGEVFIADFAAECALFFSRAPALRGAGSTGLIRLKVGASVARPASRSALELADIWINEMAGDDDVMAEYVTAESEPALANGPEPRVGSGTEESADEDTVAQLQARIFELEAQQARSASAVRSSASIPPLLRAEPKHAPMVPSQLFGSASGTVPAATLEQLKSLAGPPPPKLSQAEHAHRSLVPAPGATEAQDLLTEGQAGAIAEEDVTSIMASSKDPLHQILALQMQQTAFLTQRLASQTPKDQIAAALGNDAGSSNSNGVKGCLARDAFIRAMDDVVGAGRVMQYVEKRIALADHRLLTCMAQFLACSWQLAFDKNDEFAMGLLARRLMMVEQMCIDQGRCQFGWLLSGLPDPDLQTVAQNRKRVSLKPYARLAAAPWMAANFRKSSEEWQSERSPCRFEQGAVRRDSPEEDLESQKESQACNQRCRGGSNASVSRMHVKAAPRERGPAFVSEPESQTFGQLGVSGYQSHASQFYTVSGQDSKCARTPVVSKSVPQPVDCEQFGAQPISFLDLVHAVLQEQEAAHLGLSSFLRLSKQPPARAVHGAPDRVSDLWPCPLPLHSWTGPSRLSPRRRRRRKFLQIRAQVLQRVVAVLNWECLGSLFALISLAPDQVLRVSADDLAEMYYTIQVSEARAKRNCIGLLFDSSELRHLSCFNPEKHVGLCYVALNALAMGDSWAVEFAQQSHHNVLRFAAGCMLDHQRVAYRRAFPRSSFMEWLSIDDHIGVQVLSKQQFIDKVPLRDTDVFERAGEAYREVGLVQHPKKMRRGVQQGIFLGAELDGEAGLVSAPRDRILSLMYCTMIVARKGSCSPKLLSCILGCWVHVLMFRRPVLAILSHAFSEGANRPQNEVFQLSRESRNELCALSMLGPVCISDMRVGYAPHVFCTDASPFGGGICVAPETETVVAELWRHSEQRGYYTQLLNPSGAVLAEMGLEHVDEDLPQTPEWLHETTLRIPAPLHEGIIYDCLELFRGEGNWSAAHAASGFTVHEGIDIKGTAIAFGDLLDDSVFHDLTALALRRVVRDWHAGPPCYTYGTLRRPRLRSKEHPAGFCLKDPLTFEQTRLALRTAFLMALVVSSGLYFSVEQPGSSVMFRLQVFRRRLATAAKQAVTDTMPVIPLSEHVRSCARVGEQIQVPSAVLSEPLSDPRPFHEDPEWVEELADSLPFRELLRKHPNSRVVGLLDSRVTLGASAKGRSSSRAICRVLQGSLGYIIGGGLYPGGLHIGSKLNRSDGPSRNRPVPPPSKESPCWLEELRKGDSRRFDLVVTACQYPKNAARWLRFLLLLCGDIEPHPGPRKDRACRGPRGALDLSVGFAPATSKRMSVCLNLFDQWLQSEVNISVSQLCWDTLAAPPFMTPAWAVDKKWQVAEPGECRPVLSAAVVRAMSSICLLWQWYRFLGVTLIGFLGMLHPAEFLLLRRQDLLLPSDALHSDPVFYVHITNPKTSRFARRQHCKVDDPLVLRFVTKVFSALRSGETLFAGGASAYRKRWDAVLCRLGIPHRQQDRGATPAVLRGSGATHMYLVTEDLPRIQWRGRWSQLKTVEHYVQEVAAQTLLTRLDERAKHRLKLLDESSASGPPDAGAPEGEANGSNLILVMDGGGFRVQSSFPKETAEARQHELRNEIKDAELHVEEKRQEKKHHSEAHLKLLADMEQREEAAKPAVEVTKVQQLQESFETLRENPEKAKPKAVKALKGPLQQLALDEKQLNSLPETLAKKKAKRTPKERKFLVAVTEALQAQVKARKDLQSKCQREVCAREEKLKAVAAEGPIRAKAIEASSKGILDKEAHIKNAEEQVDACIQALKEHEAKMTSVGKMLRFNSWSESCCICCDELPVDSAATLGCGHGWYCPGCINRFVEARLDEGIAGDIPCPDCGKAISEEDLARLLPKQTIFRLHASNINRAAVASGAKPRPCPTPDCHMHKTFEEGKPACETCPLCEKESCWWCGAQPYHSGLTCEQHRKKDTRSSGSKDDESFLKWMKDTGTKQCPTCGMATSKENLEMQTDQVEECHKMICRSCGTKFCFGCNAILTESYTCGCTQNAHNFRKRKPNPNPGGEGQELPGASEQLCSRKALFLVRAGGRGWTDLPQ
eukprot:s2474_g2.t2